MIVKFKSEMLGTWVYKDRIRQVRVGSCRLLSVEKAPDQMHAEANVAEVIDGKKVVFCCVLFDRDAKNKAAERVGPTLDIDWVVDQPTLDAPQIMKFVQVDYRDGSGWATGEQTFVFASSTRVFLMSDDGKTIERL